MRALVDVSRAGRERFRVRISLADGDGRLLSEHTMWDPARCDSAEVEAAMERVERDDLEPGDMMLLGRHLFDRLLGDAWEEVADEALDNPDGLEIALRWGADEFTLHRHAWEAMHDGECFLGDHPGMPVAITRVVADAEDAGCPEPIHAPAKVLFGIGASIHDPSIRSGAEVLGLLRGIERAGGSVESKVVDSMTLAALGEACARFQPDIVHIVSHGSLDEELRRGVVELFPEDDEDSGLADGDKLLRAMREADELPSVVVLTGCESAAAGKHMDALAAELVKGGIPIAIGMAGKISDPVCRLFTRGFGTSLSEGGKLVEAMTHGRRAGLQKQEAAAADERAWSMPSIYLAPGVPGHHAPVEIAESGVLTRIADYKLPRGPVFCGRADVLREFERLLDPADDLEVLVAYAEGGEKLGKTRLQHEFAGRALRAGRIVVKLDDDVADRSRLPHATVPLGAKLLDEIVKTRGRFGLPRLFDSVLLAELSRTVEIVPELDAASPEAALTRLEGFLGECRRASVPEDAMADVLGGALVADLGRLAADVEALGDEAPGVDGGVVLILGGIGSWGSATELLFERLTGSNGLGQAERPIPVFATCSFAEDARRTLEKARDRSNGHYWERWIELRPFLGEEETLAYQWVLLHPWFPPREYADSVYTPHPDAGDAWRSIFCKQFKAIPGDFDDPSFYRIASVLADTGLFVADRDDEILREYARS